MVLGLLLAAGAALIFLMRPAIGLMALIVGSLVIPLEIQTGTQTTINVSVVLVALLTGLWLLGTLASKRRILYANRRIMYALLLFILMPVLSFAVGQLPWFSFANGAPMSAQLGGLSIFLLSACAFGLAADQIRGGEWLARLTWIFLGVSGLYVVGQLIPGLGRYVSPLFQFRATGSLFWTWLVALAFSQAAYNGRLKYHWRLLLGLLSVAAIYLPLFHGRPWASGWIPALTAAFAIVWLGAPRIGLLLSLTASVVALFNLQRVIGLVMVGDNSYSLMTRIEAWRILAEIVKVNPVLGLGPANYYWFTPLYSILGWNVQFNSHNNYVDIVAQVGLLGLASFAWLVWEVGRVGWRLRSRAPVGFNRAFVYGALGGLVGTLCAAMFADWVIPFVYNIGVAGFRSSVIAWVFLGCLVALERPLPKSVGEYRNSVGASDDPTAANA
jgi:hypothetical protein